MLKTSSVKDSTDAADMKNKEKMFLTTSRVSGSGSWIRRAAQRTGRKGIRKGKTMQSSRSTDSCMQHHFSFTKHTNKSHFAAYCGLMHSNYVYRDTSAIPLRAGGGCVCGLFGIEQNICCAHIKL